MTSAPREPSRIPTAVRKLLSSMSRSQPTPTFSPTFTSFVSSVPQSNTHTASHELVPSAASAKLVPEIAPTSTRGLESNMHYPTKGSVAPAVPSYDATPIIRELMSTRGFPEMADDAECLLALVRRARDHQSHLKSAMEDAVRCSLIQLHLYQAELKRVRRQLVEAERGVGEVRAWIRDRGIPVGVALTQAGITDEIEEDLSDDDRSAF